MQVSAGAISKTDLKRFLDWAGRNLGYPSLLQVNEAQPTAELEPIREGVAGQTDEQDMGMTYEELGIYGRLRKLSRCGPVSMFSQLLVLWKDRSVVLEATATTSLHVAVIWISTISKKHFALEVQILYSRYGLLWSMKLAIKMTCKIYFDSYNWNVFLQFMKLLLSLTGTLQLRLQTRSKPSSSTIL